MGRNALVIGATGLLGYGIAKGLCKDGWNVRAIGIEVLSDSNFFPKEIEYRCGDFYDESFLMDALKGIDKVFYFLSSTFPSTSSDSLELEVSRTLSGLDYLLRKMREAGVKEIVYPSSGGTVYGNVSSGNVKETDPLSPTTPYGVGKKMSEQMLAFYSQFGLSATILRVGNVYGTPLLRSTAQGVIDLFVQKALKNEPVTVWGDALHSVRDYIFLDDFSDAVVRISAFDAEGVEIYNLGTGIGTSLEEIIDCINACADQPLTINHVTRDSTASIKRNVLDMSKFKEKTGWEPAYDIKKGIEKTMERKKHLIRV